MTPVRSRASRCIADVFCFFSSCSHPPQGVFGEKSWHVNWCFADLFFFPLAALRGASFSSLLLLLLAMICGASCVIRAALRWQGGDHQEETFRFKGNKHLLFLLLEHQKGFYFWLSFKGKYYSALVLVTQWLIRKNMLNNFFNVCKCWNFRFSNKY